MLHREISASLRLAEELTKDIGEKWKYCKIGGIKLLI